MTLKPRTPAYFAVARTIFDHPLFNYGQHRYSRREAWEWLIAEAAYKPKGHRHLLGIAELQRGQLSASLHEMASIWRWPVTNTHRFLHRLVTEGMVILTHAPVGESGKQSGKGHARSRHIITICNYNEYQAKARTAENRPENGLDNESEYLPGIIHEFAFQQEQPTKKEVRIERVGLHGLQSVNSGDKSSTTQWKDKPPHGAKDRKTGRWQWFDHPSSEWTQAARLYAADKGTRIFPKTYKGGRGNWFKVRSDAEIKLLYQRICKTEGIPEPRRIGSRPANNEALTAALERLEALKRR